MCLMNTEFQPSTPQQQLQPHHSRYRGVTWWVQLAIVGWLLPQCPCKHMVQGQQPCVNMNGMVITSTLLRVPQLQARPPAV
jgi:hypothetical protein